MQGVIESVGMVTAKPGQGDWTRYDVHISGTKYATFDGKVGAAAMAMQGHTVEFSHTEKPSKCGKYINKALTALIGANGPAVQPSVAPLAQPVAQVHDTKGEDIKRAVVFKKACDLVGNTWNTDVIVYSQDEILKRVDALFGGLMYILDNASKTAAEVASEVFDATTETSEEQEPLI